MEKLLTLSCSSWHSSGAYLASFPGIWRPGNEASAYPLLSKGWRSKLSPHKLKSEELIPTPLHVHTCAHMHTHTHTHTHTTTHKHTHNQTPPHTHNTQTNTNTKTHKLKTNTW